MPDDRTIRGDAGLMPSLRRIILDQMAEAGRRGQPDRVTLRAVDEDYRTQLWRGPPTGCIGVVRPSSFDRLRTRKSRRGPKQDPHAELVEA